METRPIIILLGLLAANGVLADAYRWVDENGVVHFSDRPQPGAERIDLAGSSPGRASSSNRSRNTSQAQDGAEEPETIAPFSYESIEISNPVAEETLWNIEGVLSVSLSLSPELQPGHQVRVYLDGTPQLVRTANFQLEEIYRGVHNIQVEIIDETGKLMIRSRPSRFYVQQNVVGRG
jgi:hypothetical protein